MKKTINPLTKARFIRVPVDLLECPCGCGQGFEVEIRGCDYNGVCHIEELFDTPLTPKQRDKKSKEIINWINEHYEMEYEL